MWEGKMKNAEVLERLRHKLIVSCQALEDEPLHGSRIMARMAYAAYVGGASGIRANTPEDVFAIKEAVPLPVIGLYKKVYHDSEVYITPTINEIERMVDCGSDIVAIDATNRQHPYKQTIDELFEKARTKFPDMLFMADCSDLHECLHAQELGFDIVGTTMRSYTTYTKGIKIPDFELFQKLKDALTIPFIAEGGIWEPLQLRESFECGAFAAVVGTAITRPQIITRRFVDAIR